MSESYLEFLKRKQRERPIPERKPDKQILTKEEKRLLKNKKTLDYHNQMREVARDLGNCTKCYKFNINPRFNHCPSCRRKLRQYQRNYTKRKAKTPKNEGLRGSKWQ